MDYLTRHQKPVSLLDSILNEVSEIHQLLLSSEKVKSQTAARIIIYLGKQSLYSQTKAHVNNFRSQ